MRNSQVGDLLVASTIVDGTVLNQSVCLLVHEDEENAIALMLNRPLQFSQVAIDGAPDGPTGDMPPPLVNSKNFTPTSSGRLPRSNRLHDVSPTPSSHQPKSHTADTPPKIKVIGPDGDPAAGKILSGKSLHFGGPLSGPVVAIHGAAELSEAEAGEGIFMAAQRDHLEALMQNEQSQPYRLIIGHLGWTQTQLNQEISEGIWHRLPATSDILWTDDGLLWPALIQRATSSSLSRWLNVSHVAEAHLLN
ncbi:YqgE/AlgH family protein [Neorhodopirellula lusitana]|uniref:YqgE/AlgH family protein n=1 Tax=Neorhodopirellula lusitana TaxID=445327 RepID=UPI00384BF330